MKAIMKPYFAITTSQPWKYEDQEHWVLKYLKP